MKNLLIQALIVAMTIGAISVIYLGNISETATSILGFVVVMLFTTLISFIPQNQ